MNPQFLVLCACLCAMVVVSGAILFVACSYLVLKALQIHIDDYNIFFYQYNAATEAVLLQHGDKPIEAIYIVQTPIHPFLRTAFSWLHSVQPHIDFPRHTSFFIELQSGNNDNAQQRHFVTLEKMNVVQLTNHVRFQNDSEQCMKLTCSSKHTTTLNELLRATRERIGDHRFFNWNVCQNNCNDFCQDIVDTLFLASASASASASAKEEEKEEQSKARQFLQSCHVSHHLVQPSEFSLHIINCACVVYNILEKFIWKYC